MRYQAAQELLDNDQGSPGEIRDSLQDLWRVNRYLGGVRCLARALAAAVPPDEPGGALRVLDVGAGTGHVGAWMQEWLGRRGFDARVWVLDRRLSHLLAGRDLTGELRDGGGSVVPLVGDALALPLPDGSMDIVTCNLVLHHFHDEHAVRLVEGMLRVARRAVVICDVERSLWPWLFIRLAPPPLIRRISRYDGPASIRQAYCSGELPPLLEAAGARRYQILRVWPYRLGVVVWKEAA